MVQSYRSHQTNLMRYIFWVSMNRFAERKFTQTELFFLVAWCYELRRKISASVILPHCFVFLLIVFTGLNLYTLHMRFLIPAVISSSFLSSSREEKTLPFLLGPQHLNAILLSNPHTSRGSIYRVLRHGHALYTYAIYME